VNRDGKITKDEYVRGLNFDTRLTNAAEFEEAFEWLDVNKSGYLTKEDVDRHARDFYYGDDPKVSGNWLMGPLD
jgi:Ca2+-binding EF-hand superfamily protein